MQKWKGIEKKKRKERNSGRKSVFLALKYGSKICLRTCVFVTKGSFFEDQKNLIRALLSIAPKCD